MDGRRLEITVGAEMREELLVSLARPDEQL
jgi:hypothetical protein